MTIKLCPQREQNGPFLQNMHPPPSESFCHVYVVDPHTYMMVLITTTARSVHPSTDNNYGGWSHMLELNARWDEWIASYGNQYPSAVAEITKLREQHIQHWCHPWQHMVACFRKDYQRMVATKQTGV